MLEVYHLHLLLVMGRKKFLVHKVLKDARVMSMRRPLKKMLVVKNLKMNLNQSLGRDNHLECQYHDQKWPQLFHP